MDLLSRLPRPLRPANLLFIGLTVLGLVSTLYPFWAPGLPETTGARTVLLLFSVAVGLLLLALLSEAQQGLTVHTMAMMGALVGLNTMLRVIETIIPMPGGFSPVFLMIMLIGHGFGARLGFLAGALTMLVSGPLTAGGLGPWTPYQMLAAGWVGMGASLLPSGRVGFPLLVLYGVLWGWLYGAITSLYYWPYAFGAPDIAWEPDLNAGETLLRYGRYYLVTSALWDTTRALGNGILLLVLGPSLMKALERFRRRAHVSWESPQSESHQV